MLTNFFGHYIIILQFQKGLTNLSQYTSILLYLFKVVKKGGKIYAKHETFRNKALFNR